jgi:hypothetical protein
MGKTYRPDKFENFLNAFGAARLLLQEAHNNGSLLEGLVLYASMVDGFCRIALILKEQLESKGSAINDSYIYQPSDKDFFSERKIFNLAHSQGILDEELNREIARLYDIRNKAIHRFFTSEIEYTHLEHVLGRYEVVYQKLSKIVHELEAEQVRQNVGMTRTAQMSEADNERARQAIFTKIRSGSEITFAKTLGVVSATEVIEFGRQEGLFDKCRVCEHAKLLHIDQKAMERCEKGNEITSYVGVVWPKAAMWDFSLLGLLTSTVILGVRVFSAISADSISDVPAAMPSTVFIKSEDQI